LGIGWQMKGEIGDLSQRDMFFQSYIFGVVCKISNPSIDRNGSPINLHNLNFLEKATSCISKTLLDFFVKERDDAVVMHPVTNSNVVIYFFWYRESPYYLQSIFSILIATICQTMIDSIMM